MYCSQLDRYAEYKTKTQGMIVDGVQYVNEAYDAGKSLISEGANAVMLDVDYGTCCARALCACVPAGCAGYVARAVAPAAAAAATAASAPQAHTRS